ncbi:MAG: methyl-accepting chemotaxis protein, partial [Actinomycetota bacterium]|nr:methyl-accepting chemotaxis protein [Actinomycetota bacterium]
MMRKLNLSNVRISTQVIGLFLLISALAVATFAVGYFSMNALAGQAEKSFLAMERMDEVLTLQTEVTKLKEPVNTVVHLKNQQLAKQYYDHYAKAVNALKEIDRSFSGDIEVKETINGMQTDLAALDASAKQIFASYNQGSAMGNLENFNTLAEKINERADKLHGYVDERQRKDVNQVSSLSSTVHIIQLITILMVLAVCAASIIYIKKGVVGKLVAGFNQMSDIVRGVAASAKEISNNSLSVSEAANQIASAISQVASGAVEQTRSTSEALAIANQIRTAVEQVAKGAQNQASAVSDTVIGVNRLADAIDRVSSNARAVSDVASATKDTANQGKETVGQAIDGMKKTKEKVEASANKIQALGEKSKQIGEII